VSVITIREAQRAGARLLIGLAGTSGGGKTYSALRLAYGLANCNSRKIGFLDTENRRGSLYADKLPNKETFLIADLIPPFSPQRYIEAVRAFEKQGVEVLIIDSISHVWEGEGGCCEIAEKNRLGENPNWALAKGQHKLLVNTMLYSNMHVIVCVRARYKSKPVKKFDPKKNKEVTTWITSDDVEPICEGNFMFEMTASMVMDDMGKSQRVKKCPEDLVPYLGRGQGYITEQDGLAIRAWVDGLGALDPTVEKYRARFMSIVENGTQAIADAISKTPQEVYEKLGQAFFESLGESAAEYDRQKITSETDSADITEQKAGE
jgi:hypothetical protein